MKLVCIYYTRYYDELMGKHSCHDFQISGTYNISCFSSASIQIQPHFTPLDETQTSFGDQCNYRLITWTAKAPCCQCC